jgi:hypothetical protein
MYTNYTLGTQNRLFWATLTHTVQEDAWEDNIHAVLETWMVLKAGKNQAYWVVK